MQPPSGGCVLKPEIIKNSNLAIIAAAFGRLCVETDEPINNTTSEFAAAFGRLCVETKTFWKDFFCLFGSRLRAAVC